MRPERKRAIWIVYQLHKRGSSSAEVARNLGITRCVVSNVMAGRRTSRRVKEEVARILGMPVEKIWKEEAKGRQ